MSPTKDQYEGSLLGLALGDAFGAPHEGGPLEKLLWRFLRKTPDGLYRFTDDTQMSIDLAESLLASGKVDQSDLAQKFAASYRWDRGYGPGAARILKKIRKGITWRVASCSVYPNGSYGNGGAMRSPVVALFFYQQPTRIAQAAREAAEVTHAHPLGIEAAVFIAEATAAALSGASGPEILEKASQSISSAEYSKTFNTARTWLNCNAKPAPREVRSCLGMGITAPLSCVTAIYLAARFLAEPFESMLKFAANAGGDVDTVAAIAGAIWGARNGAAGLPMHFIQQVEDSARIRDLASQLYQRTQELPSSD